MVRFWYLGEWRNMVLDDQLLCLKSEKKPGKFVPIGAECKDGRTVFLSIMEKAYCKLHNKISNVDCGGFARNSMVDIYGGTSRSETYPALLILTIHSCLTLTVPSVCTQSVCCVCQHCQPRLC